MYMVQVIARGVYIVIGSEKRGNFAQNAKFYHFQTVTTPMPSASLASR